MNIELPDALLEAVAERAAEMLAERNDAAPEPWLDVPAAAEYLAVSRSELYSKCSRRDLHFPTHKEGSRSYFRRDELDRWRLEHNNPNGGPP